MFTYSNDSSNKTKVKFLPFWHKNPYQILLAKHLEKLDIQVEAVNPDSTIFFLAVALRGGKPDILHFHTLHPFFLAKTKLTLILKFILFFSQTLILRLMGVKIVWTVHDLKSHENTQIKSERIFSICFAKFASGIITHCSSAKQEVAKLFRLKNDDKIFVIPHGNYIGYYEQQISQVEARKILGIPDEGLLFLFLGLIRPYKGVPELIDAFKQLHDDNVYLAIAGEAVTAGLAQEINSMALGHANIKFIPGYIADDKIQVYMKASDAVVLPYRDILTSGSVILAMSFAKACVAPRKGCIGEVLEKSGAFLYDLDAEDGLLKAMKQTVQSQAELVSLGERHRQTVEQWNWDRISEMTFKVYQAE